MSCSIVTAVPFAVLFPESHEGASRYAMQALLHSRCVFSLNLAELISGSTTSAHSAESIEVFIRRQALHKSDISVQIPGRSSASACSRAVMGG
jgi:hypothetical protein